MSQAQKTFSAPKKTTGQKISSTISWIIVIGLVLWSTTGMSFDWQKALNSMPIVKRIFQGLFHPEWTFFNESEGVVDNMLITLETAFLGTSAAAILAVPFGFLAARNMSKRFVWISWIGKRILNVIRTLPELIVAIVFLVAVGPGPFAGMLAIGFHSIGMIGKLYSEAIENMDEGPMEALTAVGANRIQTLFFSVLPQVLPEFFSFALYKFEIDVRAASVLGMVGAGGIGTPLLFSLQSQAWNRVGIIFIGIIIAVVIIDFISGAIRKRLV
ncbi:phosphonate ABC transporter, permease protein PhnE [Tumebacillus sp. ITR2]|uniref:Phosphonate ABC transporter, permease protein PhnE n=1 Tax=Tumebacillus amylolyticus TaxID=2801339 RepID=A0ABS1J856_9BACL|nr:phosphonate ABC transporter, permease protein PhnE [Tumebacillus amylolyticus]MBL0386422.1 phosphonate ABC transporter, permease protein PhnE [Tumebacillus amylolyticus]